MFSDMLVAIAQANGSQFADEVRHLARQLAGRPGWVPLTDAMLATRIPDGWSRRQVRAVDGTIDVALSRTGCFLFSDAATSRVIAAGCGIVPHALAISVGGRPATAVFGHVAPFDREGWVTDLLTVAGAQTTVIIRVPALSIELTGPHFD